jgi:hypothetical protein
MKVVRRELTRSRHSDVPHWTRRSMLVPIIVVLTGLIAWVLSGLRSEKMESWRGPCPADDVRGSYRTSFAETSVAQSSELSATT